MTKVRRRSVYIIPVTLLSIVLAGYVLYPLAMTLNGSLHIHGAFSFDRYLQLIDPENKGGWEAVRNSVLVSVLSVLFSGCVGVLFAFVLTQFQFPFRKLLSKLAILPIALPPLVGVISFLFVFGESGMLPRVLQLLLRSDRVPFYAEGIGAIVLVHVYSFYVYFYLFVSSALRQLDPSIVEAASGLGSSPFHAFRRVVVPELRSALTGASILTFMTSMASFSAPFLFGGENRFMTTQIYATKLNGELDLAAAQSVTLTLASVAFFILLSYANRRNVTTKKTKGAFEPRPLVVSRPLKLVLLTLCLALFMVELFPIITIVLISFVREGSWTWQIFPSEFTFTNYVKLFSDPRVFEPVRNSVVMGILTVVMSLPVGVVAAYVVAKGGLRKAKLLVDVAVMLPFAIPGTVIAIGLILAFNTPSIFTGYTVLVGSFWILPLAYFIRSYPLVVRSTTASLEQLDDALMEAGETFGAGMFRRFRTIAFPLILPGIVSGSLLAMIAALGEFVSSVLLYTYASRPISIEILSQLRGYNFGSAAAYCVVLLMLIMVLIRLSSWIIRRFRPESGGLDF